MGGIGCLVIILAVFLGGGALVAKFLPQIQEYFTEAQANPEKAAAKLAIKLVPGAQILREDDTKREFTFKISDQSEELTLNYANIQSGQKPVITNSKGEVVSLEKIQKDETPSAPPAPATNP